MNNEPTSSDVTSAEQQDEIRRLRRQVEGLQAELGRRSTASVRAARGDDDEEDDLYENDYGRLDDLSSETRRMARDLVSRATDESSKLSRAMTFAALEQVRQFGEILSIFSDEVLRRNRPERYTGHRAQEPAGFRNGDTEDPEQESASGIRSGRPVRSRQERAECDDRSTISAMAGDLPSHICAGAVSALNEALSMPSRVIDRFNETYRESDDLRTRTRYEARQHRRRAEKLARQAQHMTQEAETAERRAADSEPRAGATESGPGPQRG
jgi:hypothetical protein